MKPHGVIGWREWCALPALGIGAIKAKIDTGARTSALHAFDISVSVGDDGVELAHFSVQPAQRRRRSAESVVRCVAPIIDRRMVTNSGGHASKRLVIRTPVAIGDATWSIELTLANRDAMGFRMLLGRTGVRGRFLVDPGRSYAASGGASRGRNGGTA